MTNTPDSRPLESSSAVDNDSSSTRGGGEPADTSQPSRPGKVAGSIKGLALFLAGAGLLFAAIRGVLSTIDTTGLVDENYKWLGFLVGVGSAVLTAFGTDIVLKTWLKMTRAWRIVISVAVAVATIGLTAWVLMDRPNQEYVQGEINDETPFATRTLLSGKNGSRYYITLDTVPGLTAKFSVRGAGQEIAGILTDGRLVAEGVLAGDATWTVVITPLEGSGKYLLYVDSLEPERLSISPEPQERGFDPGRARSSFVFDVRNTSEGKGAVFVQVKSLTENEPNPGWALRSSQGITIATRVAQDPSTDSTEKQHTFTTVLPGEYVLEVFGTIGQQFEVTVNDRNPEAPNEVPEAPSQRLEPIPSSVQFQAPGSDVVAALVGAKFVAQTVPVCSNSFAADDLPVGSTRQIVKSGAATASDEIVILDENGLRTENLSEGNTLPEGTRLDVKTFSGLPCQ